MSHQIHTRYLTERELDEWYAALKATRQRRPPDPPPVMQSADRRPRLEVILRTAALGPRWQALDGARCHFALPEGLK